MSGPVTNARVAYGGVFICWLLFIGLAVSEVVVGHWLGAGAAVAIAWALAMTLGRATAGDLKRAHEYEERYRP